MCRELFRRLGRGSAECTELSDLPQLRDRRLEEIVKVAYLRKQRSSFFDFLFALWDSEALPRLSEYCWQRKGESAN
jgi:hypothetical protein